MNIESNINEPRREGYKSLADSLPPPHPSKFSQRTNYESQQRNLDLKTSEDTNRNDFLTVGRDSK